MVNVRANGYRVEYKIRKLFEKAGWRTIRSGASLGETDLVCFKNNKCFMLQVKSTIRKKLYFNEYMEPKLEGYPFYLVVDFGKGNIKIMEPKKISTVEDGEDIKDFIKKNSN